MAVTMLGDLLPYNNQIRTGYIDGIRAASNVFNAKSNNTIRYTSKDLPGTKTLTAYWKGFGNVSRRDITSTSDQTPEKIERAEHADFRTYFKLNLTEWTATAFSTADKMKPDAVYYALGVQLAKKRLEESLKQAINIAATAIESGNGDTNETVLDLVTGTPRNFLQTDINFARMKFGEHYPLLRMMVMHSAVFFVLAQNQTVNYQYDLGGGMTLYGGIPATMGMPFIVTDQPSLVYTSGGNTCYKTLLLTENAVEVSDASDLLALAAPIPGKENIMYGYQAEWSMWNNVKGYELKATAGTNPDDAALSTVANWQMWTADKRNGAGLLVKSIADMSAVKQIFDVRIAS